MDTRWYHLDSKVKALRTAHICSILDENRIEHLVLKGVAVQRFYPEGELRPSVDIDIAVDPPRYQEAKLLERNGIFPDANIDFHKGLEYFSGRSWGEVYVRSRPLEIENSSIRVLSDEDLLRLISIHWLADGGERRGRLKDLTHILASIDDDFDWDYFLKAENTARTNQAILGIRLATKYHQLSLDSLPKRITDIEIPLWVLRLLEKRWSDGTVFKPLDHDYDSVADFAGQLRHRFPPNPLMAIVALGKDPLSANPRISAWKYFFSRMFPSLFRNIRNRVKKRNA